MSSIKKVLLEILFPRFCLGCHKEGGYLCQDCFSLIPLSEKTSKARRLFGLYFAADYNNFLLKRIVQRFKYPPFAKELSMVLVYIILSYFQNLEKPPPFLINPKDYVFVPVPLHKKRLRWRGFNQAEKIAKGLSSALGILLYTNVLIRQKETLLQIDLLEEERKENIKGAFSVFNAGLIQDRKILLVDDVYTTGATMEECARTLKEAGAKEILGITVARG